MQGAEFEMYWEGGSFVSTITDCEDVSYVTSPLVLDCMRECTWPSTTSNAHRAHEAAEGGANIRDELDEKITLDGVRRAPVAP